MLLILLAALKVLRPTKLANNCVPLVIVLMLFVLPVGSCAEPTQQDRAPNCGIRSLVDLSVYFGKPIAVNKFDALCRTYSPPEISMLDIKNAATLIGVPLEGYKISLTELANKKYPAILALSNHFVFTDCVSTRWVRVVEDSTVTMRRRSEIERDYQGYALVPSQGFLSSHRSLVADSMVRDMGQLPFGTAKTEVTIYLTNVTKGILRIAEVTPECSCTVPHAPPRREIPAGTTLPLTLTISLPDTGELQTGVTISTFPDKHKIFVSLAADIAGGISITGVIFSCGMQTLY